MFRTRELVTEELRNIAGARLASSILAVGVAAITAASLQVATIDTVRILDDDHRFVSAGISTYSVSRPDRTPLDAARCEALNKLDGIRAAGGISSSTTMTSAARPGQPLPVRYGTEHAAEVLWPDSDATTLKRSSVIAGSSLSRELGLQPGSRLGLTGAGTAEVALVDAIATPSTRISNVNSGVLIRQAGASIQSCLIEIDPNASDAVQSVVLASWDPDEVVISPLFVDPLDTYFPLVESLESRLGTWLPWSASALILILVAGYSRSRRWDFAIYRRHGLRPAGSLVFAATHYAVLVALPALIATTGWVAVSVLTGVNHDAMIWVIHDGSALFLSLPLAVLLSTFLIGRVTPSDVFAER